MHFDATTGGFFDSSPARKGTALSFGNAQISAADKKFGDSSLLLDGTGDYIRYLAYADWGMGTGNFTYDFWVKFNSTVRQYIFENGVSVGAFIVTPSSGLIEVYQGAHIINTGATPFVTGQWYHLALVRNGNAWTVYRDGVAYVSNASNASAWGGAANALTIGATASGTLPANCRIEEFRVSKGIARWTASFTPPDVAYGPPPRALIILTTVGAGTWTVPSDWDSGNNLIECIGAGGGGGSNTGNGAGGAGGGAYSSISNLALTPNASISFSVGAAGVAGTGTGAGGAGGDTWFSSTATVLAKGGVGGGTSNGGAGGASASGIGTVKFSGGAGDSGSSPKSGPGGGAGGSHGAGGAGDNGGGSGGAGDAGYGGAVSNMDLVGNPGAEYSPTHGCGGGGGGRNTNTAGLAGGLYGGGGGGSKNVSGGGAGTQGMIVIRYG
jgi:hypothetical protein